MLITLFSLENFFLMNDNIINELKFHHMIMNLMKNMMSSLFLSLIKCNHQIIMEYTYKCIHIHIISLTSKKKSAEELSSSISQCFLITKQ